MEEAHNHVCVFLEKLQSIPSPPGNPVKIPSKYQHSSNNEGLNRVIKLFREQCKADLVVLSDAFQTQSKRVVVQHGKIIRQILGINLNIVSRAINLISYINKESSDPLWEDLGRLSREFPMEIALGFFTIAEEDTICTLFEKAK